jgi:hypothetical protein
MEERELDSGVSQLGNSLITLSFNLIPSYLLVNQLNAQRYIVNVIATIELYLPV